MEQLELFEDAKEQRKKSLKDLFDSLEEFQEIFQQGMNEAEQEQEQFWRSLTEERQLKAFCAVVRRIHQGEIIDKGSYRHVLYSVFGFGPESYGQAQCAGYLEIHNSIVRPNEQIT